MAKNSTFLFKAISFIYLFFDLQIGFSQSGPVCDAFSNIKADVITGLGDNYIRRVFVSGDKIFAVTASGLSISTDGGINYTNKTTAHGLGSNGLFDVYVSGDTVVVATTNGLSISYNGGSTFTNKTTTNGLGNNQTRSVKISGGIIYVGTEGGLSLSADGGMTFTNLTTANGLPDNFIYGLCILGNSIYAATNSGLGISTNRGLTFITKNTSHGLGNNLVHNVYALGNNIYAATDEGISISTNSGVSFNNIVLSSQLNRAALDVYAIGSKIFVSGYDGLSISTDGGNTFMTNKKTTDGLGSDFVFGVFASGDTIYAATYNGLSISYNGGTSFTNNTTTRASGLGSNSLWAVKSFGSTIYVCGEGGLSISNDQGSTFTNISTGLLNNTVRDVSISGSTLYAATLGALSISTDGGTSYSHRGSLEGLGSSTVYGVYAHGSTVYAATSSGLSVSTDGGDNFSNKTTSDGLGSNLVLSVYYDGGVLYAGTTGGLSISTDNGATFSTKTTSNGLGSNTILRIFVSGTKIFVATAGGLSISTDGGSSFTNRTTAHGLGNNIVRGIYALGNTVYAGTDGGLGISTDGGLTFVNKTTLHGLGSNTVRSAIATSNKIYAATSNGLSSCTSCTQPTSGGTIAAAQSGLSPFDPSPFTSLTEASGHVGTLEYKWQSSSTSNIAAFSDIASSNAVTYDPGSITQTTWYKRVARVTCSTDWTGAVSSNVLEVTVADNLTWNGSASTDWNTASNWTPAFVPSSSIPIVIPSGTSRYPTNTPSISINQLSIESGANLSLGSSILSITGSLTNNGTISASAGKLTMSGSSSQTISGTGTIAHLEINNAAGVSIASGAGHMQTITGMLTPTSGTLTTNGNLTLKSDATGTARVGAGSASGGYITGDVVTQRHLTKLTGTGRNGRAWRLVSVPVAGTGTLRDYFMGGRSGADLTVSANRSAEPDALGTVVIGHNQPDAATATAAGFDWIGVAGQVSSLRYYTQSSGSGSFASAQVPSLSTTYTAAAQGYMLFSRGDRQQNYQGTSNSSTTKLQATGTLKQGTQTVTIPALASAGYVLVGNPYMSVIDMDLVYNDNSTIIDPVVYVWDANSDGNTYKQGGYRTITRTGPGAWTTTGGGANPQYIESHAAFFVRPTAAGGTLQIKEAHKVTGMPGIAPHGTDGNNPARLFVNLEVTDTVNRRLVDGAVVFFGKDYSESLKDAVDIPVMSNITAGAVGLKQSGMRLAMEGRPWPADSLQRSIPVDMRNLGEDPYVLRLIGESLTKDGFRAWLRDRHLKSETEMKVDGELLYPFLRTGDAGIDSGRFEIVYRTTPKSTGSTVTPDNASETPSVKLFPNPSKTGEVKLSLRAMAPGAYTVQVLDMMGREVATGSLEHKSINGEYRMLKGKRLSPGQYIIRLIDADKQPKETLRMVVE